MKIKTLIKDFPLFFAFIIVCIAFSVITLFLNRILFFFEIAAIIIIVFLLIKKYDILSLKAKSFKTKTTSDFSFLESNENKFSIPVAVCDSKCNIIWSNSVFDNCIISNNGITVNEIATELGDVGYANLIETSENGHSFAIRDRYYVVYPHILNESQLILYFIDFTKFRHMAENYVNTRPVVMIITIDNLVEIQQNYSDYESEAIINSIQKYLSEWLERYPCFFTKFGDSKFYVVCEKQNLDDMMKRKFDILDSVRNYTFDNKFVGASLSIGAGTGIDICECENNAKLSLDLSVGRGGDQATVKEKENFEFFGGVNKSVEVSSKTKSRLVASAINDLISQSDSVFIVGHKYPDFDSIASSLGILSICLSNGKKCHIVTDRSKTLSDSLLEYADSQNFSKYFLKSGRAKTLIKQSKNPLVFVVDTHIKNFVEFPELLDETKNIAVIDHHRKSVDYISDATVFFHDPAASSASEMVTELIEYSPCVNSIGSCIADALLAGIMLDTKNFVLRSNSRTFEAAAFLKRKGADTVRVKKLFNSDYTDYLYKNEIISSSESYMNCMIAKTENNYNKIRLLASQAADELMNINDIDASFVIFREDDKTCVSARSYGKINVQLIMEKLGGGGHQTMAAAQCSSTVSEVETKIKEYLENVRSN